MIQRLFVLSFFAATLSASAAFAQSTSDGIWQETPITTTRSRNTRMPLKFRSFSVGFDEFRKTSAAVATTVTPKGEERKRIILPLPEGGESSFTLADSGVLSVKAMQESPDIRSYMGTDKDGRHLRLDISPFGIQAMVTDKDGTWFVEPLERRAGKIKRAIGTDDKYLLYNRKDLPAEPPAQHIHEDAAPSQAEPEQKSTAQPQIERGGATLRLFNIRYAMSESYLDAFEKGIDSKNSKVIAYEVVMTNRLNEIFERDLGIHFNLSDGSYSPYNVYALSIVLDIDPVGDWGEAGRWPLCSSPDSDGGYVTILTANPVGNDYLYDVIPQEIGHLLGAGHTFSGCGPVAQYTHLIEPRSGTTIMSYDGICRAQNIVNNTDSNGHQHPDLYFNAYSINEIRGYLKSEPECGETKYNYKDGIISVNEPHLDRSPNHMASFANDKTIPAHTPFVLQAEASGDLARMSSDKEQNFTYSWDETDLALEHGNVSTYGGDDKDEYPQFSDPIDGPLFRSFPPVRADKDHVARRTFSRLAYILGDLKDPDNYPRALGETYPTTTRDLSFLVTIRDNNDAVLDVSPYFPEDGPTPLPQIQGQPQESYKEWLSKRVFAPTTLTIPLKFHVLDTGHAFAITSPSENLSWLAGSVQTIKWDVAKTDEAPISCKFVTIEMSKDGGYTYLPTPLASHVANNGHADVQIPRPTKIINAVQYVADSSDPADTKVRYKISCDHNIFFAISPTNSTITY